MDIALKLVLVALVVIWLALVTWTFMDARRRIADRFLVGCATLAALFPFIGSLIYLIVRPPELLEDVRERDLEIAAAEARLAQAKGSSCPHCDAPTQPDFLRCPSCLRKLREACPSCARPLDQDWRICPYCEADPLRPTNAPAAPARRRRSGNATPTRTPEAVSGQDQPTGQAKPATKATTKAAAKRSTRRKTAGPAPAAVESADPGSGPTSARRRPSGDGDASPEAEATA